MLRYVMPVLIEITRLGENAVNGNTLMEYTFKASRWNKASRSERSAMLFSHFSFAHEFNCDKQLKQPSNKGEEQPEIELSYLD